MSSDGSPIFLFYTAAAAQTNAPRPAAGMALFQPRDWFSAAQLSLSLAVRVKRWKNLIYQSTLTMFHISKVIPR